MNWFTLFLSQPCLLCLGQKFPGATEMTGLHGDFGFERFEAGRGLWHARNRRANHQSVTNDVAFPHLEVGFAWPDCTAAIEEAHFDRFASRRASRDDTAIQPATIA